MKFGERLKNIAFGVIITSTVVAAITDGIFGFITMRDTETIKKQNSISELRYTYMKTLVDDIVQLKKIDFGIIDSDNITKSLDEYNRYHADIVSMYKKAECILSNESVLYLTSIPYETITNENIMTSYTLTTQTVKQKSLHDCAITDLNFLQGFEVCLQNEMRQLLGLEKIQYPDVQNLDG